MVSVRDLQVRFQTTDRRATVKAVDGVNFDVRRGETFGIIGESGSGKTTIGRALVFLLKPSARRDPARRHRSAGAAAKAVPEPPPRLPDHFSGSERGAESAHDASRRCWSRWSLRARGPERNAAGARAQALDRVGLPQEIGERYPHQLSGGQKQRVVIARALTLRPKLIVCDEVVAALDMSIRGDVLNLFADLQRELGTHLCLHHPRPRRGLAYQRACRGDVSRSVRRTWSDRKPLGTAIASLYAGAVVGRAAAACPRQCAAASGSCWRAKSRARSIRRRAAASAPAAAMRKTSARTRCRTGASWCPVTGSPVTLPTARIFRRSGDRHGTGHSPRACR